MKTDHHSANPFAMMLDLQGVVAAVADSEPLAALNSRVYQLLDESRKTVIGVGRAEPGARYGEI